LHKMGDHGRQTAVFWRKRRADGQQRYIRRYLLLAQKQAAPLVTNYDKLESDHNNLMLALTRAYQQADWATVIRFGRRLCDAVNGYLMVRGYWAELYQKVELAIESARQKGDVEETAVFLHHQAILHHRLGNYQSAREAYEASLAIDMQSGNEEGIAQSQHNLAALLHEMGDFQTARRLYTTSLNSKQRTGDKKGRADSYHQLGLLAQQGGQYDEAERLYRQSLALHEQLRDELGKASNLHQLGNLAYLRGDLAEATRLYEICLIIHEQWGNKLGVATAVHQLATMAYLNHEFDRAWQLYEKSLQLKSSLGDQAGVASTLHQMGVLLQEGANGYAMARDFYQQCLTLAKTIGDTRQQASTLGQLGNLARDEGDLLEAEQYYQAALQLTDAQTEPALASLRLFNLARLYEEQGQLDNAVALLEQVVALDEQYNLPDLMADRQALSRLYERIG
jgi:tetratricopeptide (TPR) repeat protein